MGSNVVGDLFDALLKGDTDEGKLLRIEAFMILILLVFLVLVLLGSFRRVSRSSVVQVPLWLAYASSYSLLFYTVGLMNSAPFQQDLFAIWAIVVLYALDSTDSISAFSLEDNETVYRSLWDTFIAVLYVGMVVATQSRSSNLKVQIWTLYGACMARPGIKISARYLASKASVLKHSTKVVADFMSYEHELDQNNADCSDEFMAGYHYIVKGDDESFAMLRQPDYKYRLLLDQDKVVTVSKIWICDGPLLASKPAGDRLKDLCLSFAMFKLLRRRFAEYPLHELESEQGKAKTWEFVHRGLLSGAGSVERAFRVVEEELAFVFDFFYTKYAAMLDRGFPALKIGAELLTFAYSIWIAVELSNGRELRIGDQDRSLSSVEGSRVGIDVLVTRIVLCSWAGAQFFQLYALLTSNWLKVWLVCKYVRGRRLRKPIEWCVGFLGWLRYFRPWSNKIGQHDILTSTFQSNKGLWNFAMTKLRGVVPEKTAVRLPDEVKTAVLQQLIKSHGPEEPSPLFGGGEPKLQPFALASRPPRTPSLFGTLRPPSVSGGLQSHNR